MKEKWTTDMNQRLQEHRMAPPAGLWEGISEQMRLNSVPAAKAVAMKRWAWAVAAVILVLVGFFAVYQFDTDKPLSQPVSQTSEAVNQQLVLADVPQQAEKKPAPKASVTVSVKKPFTAPVTAPVETSQPDSVETPHKTAAEITQQVSAETPREMAEDKALQQPSVVVSRYAPSAADYPAAASRPNSQLSAASSVSRWSVGMNASGGLLASAGQSRTDRLYSYNAEYAHAHSNEYAMNGSFSEEANTIPGTSYTLTDFVTKHLLPVSFGLSVHYQLNPRLSLLSGVSYTYLYSEFTIPLHPNIHNHQKLHYIGIPAGLAWQLWKTRAFRLYLSGTAMLEKCVNAKPWQWSVSAAAGAEYAVTPQFGIYLEPSLGYYFNDGTSFDHYYKEHPVAPSIAFGLRLHINEK